MATRQHYLPVFYLKGFTDPDTPTGQEPYVWVFPFAESRWRRRAPENVAAESGFYDFTDEQGNVNQEFEQFLSQAEYLAALVLREKILRQVSLTDQERSEFASFVALIHARVPGQQDHIREFLSELHNREVALEYEAVKRDPMRLERVKEKYRRETGKSDMDNLTVETLDPSKYRIIASRPEVLSTSLEVVMIATPFIESMGWMFAVTEPPHYFVTSDYPFCVVSLSNPRLASPGLGGDSEVTLPLSREVALVANRRTSGTRWARVPFERVQEINLRSLSRADRFLVAPKDSFPGWGTIRASLEEERRGTKPEG